MNILHKYIECKKTVSWVEVDCVVANAGMGGWGTYRLGGVSTPSLKGRADRYLQRRRRGHQRGLLGCAGADMDQCAAGGFHRLNADVFAGTVEIMATGEDVRAGQPSVGEGCTVGAAADRYRLWHKPCGTDGALC